MRVMLVKNIAESAFTLLQSLNTIPFSWCILYPTVQQFTNYSIYFSILKHKSNLFQYQYFSLWGFYASGFFRFILYIFSILVIWWCSGPMNKVLNRPIILKFFNLLTNLSHNTICCDLSFVCCRKKIEYTSLMDFYFFKN